MHNGGPGGRPGMNGGGEKAKNSKLALKKLIAFNKPLFTLIVVALILSAVSSILSIVGPDKLKDMTNLITEGMASGINLEKITEIGLVLVLLYALSGIFNYAQGFIMAIVTNKFSQKMRSEISKKINQLPLSYFDKTTVGNILSRVTNDVDTISQTMNQSLGSLVSAITLFIGAIIMMFVTNWIMAVAAILSSLFGFVLMMLIMSKSQKYFFNVQNELGNINGLIEEVYSGHNVVKAYNAEAAMEAKFDRINGKLFRSGLKSQFYSGLMRPLMDFTGNFGYVVVCIVGAMLAMNGAISFGIIVAFMIYIRLFTQPLSTFAQSLTQLQSAAAASERVFEFLDERNMADEKHLTARLNPKTAKGEVEFSHVKFGYEKDRLIIKDFSAIAHSGQKIAIVGPTGAGKTTMVNLLMKFYNVDGGDIKIDGVSLHDLPRENVHELFTMVLQDTWLFEGTIKENVRYNNRATDAEIKKACKTVGLDHFIKTLPDGYNSVLGDTDSLSAGQKQLLTIARSMINDSPLLILDEATSNVDTRTEELVAAAMDKLTVGRTSFIIAHRLSTIKNADLILVMKDGDIIEQGNHEELLEKGGFYANLYNSQFQKTS